MKYGRDTIIKEANRALNNRPAKGEREREREEGEMESCSKVTVKVPARLSLTTLGLPI